MGNFDIIKEFFTNMRCSQCHVFFEKSDIKVLRQDYNYTVVKVVCSSCGKNIGLAILGMDKESLKKQIETTEDEYQNEDAIPFDISEEEPINYDDVIDAHKFFYNLGSDWAKFLPDHK